MEGYIAEAGVNMSMLYGSDPGMYSDLMKTRGHHQGFRSSLV
jgi:hypothetical protein